MGTLEATPLAVAGVWAARPHDGARGPCPFLSLHRVLDHDPEAGECEFGLGLGVAFTLSSIDEETPKHQDPALDARTRLTHDGRRVEVSGVGKLDTRVLQAGSALLATAGITWEWPELSREYEAFGPSHTLTIDVPALTVPVEVGGMDRNFPLPEFIAGIVRMAHQVGQGNV